MELHPQFINTADFLCRVQPRKFPQGIEVDLTTSRKLRKLAKQYQSKGFLKFFIEINCRAIAEHGYFYVFNYLHRNNLAAFLDIPREHIEKIVHSMVNHGLFDRDAFYGYDILTNKNLQLKFLNRCQHQGTKTTINLYSDIWLLEKRTVPSVSPYILYCPLPKIYAQLFKNQKSTIETVI